MRTLLAAVLTATLLAAPSARAQDAHYWTFQYGPRSSLLGGAVIGSVDDVSATYYNPGALGLSAHLPFAVSANVFEVSGVILEDGGGNGVDLGTKRSRLRPSLIAGTIGRNLLGRDVLAYSALTRTRGTQDLEGVLVASGTQIDPGLGLRDLVGLAKFTGEFSDTWLGLSYGVVVGSSVGIGVTWYGALRDQWRRAETVTQVVSTNGSGLSITELVGGSYSTIRTLAKLGMSFARGPVTAGVTVTTPSLRISGSGKVGLDRAMFGTDTTALAASVQPDLAANYRSPLSVGGGASLRLGRTRFHGSAEWFDAIAPYEVMQGQDFVAQLPPDTVAVDVVQAMDEVVNWAVGIEHAFSPRLSAYLSYATDRSGLTNKVERAGLSILPIDISTATVGTEFGVAALRFTLGFGYGWGRKVDQQLTDLINQNDPDFQATYVYRGLRLLFGFEVGG